MNKKDRSVVWRRGFSGLLSAALLFAPAAAQAPALSMLDDLQRGEWELRFRDGSPARRICLHTGRELIQLRHPHSGCSQYIVDDTQNLVKVQYTCPGSGYGLTSIREETTGLVQVHSTGMARSQAFDFTAEARRVGNCR